MDYKIYLYALNIFLSIFILSGINFTGFFKTNHYIEARLFVIVLSMIMSYLLTNFICDFLNF